MSASTEPTLGFFGRITSWWYGGTAQSSTASSAEATDSSVQEAAQSAFNAQAIECEKKGADLPPISYRGKALEIRNLGMENTLKDLIAELARQTEKTEDKVHIIFHHRKIDVKEHPELLERSIQEVAKTISYWGLVPQAKLVVLVDK